MYNLKLIRVKHGKTQNEIAELLNVSTVGYGQYERNQREPNIEVLKRLSKIYQCSVDELIDNDYKPKSLLAPKEESLIATFNKLNNLGQEVLFAFAQGLLTNREYLRA